MAGTLAQRSGPGADLVIRGARLVDPAEGLDARRDLLVRDGRIAAIGDAVEAPPEAEEVDADGQVVLPAFVDPHVHLRVPGQEHKEDLATGSRAAAAGGYCAVLSMPNTDPVIDTGAVLDASLERAREEAVVRVGFLACVSVGQKGEQLAELGDLADRGAAGFTDDGRPVWSAGLLRRALQYARPLGLPIALHCEEPTLSRGGHAHEGAVSAELGFGGWPSIAESTMVARDVRIAAYEDAHVHLQHLSVRESVEEVAWARARRLRVTAEATPHHLVLTDEALRELDANAKMNPPLATEGDRKALIDAVRDGTIDIIATDHAPHALEEKEQPFEAAPFGVTGLETAFPVLYTELVQPGLLRLETVVERMTTGPCAAFGLERPRIAVGATADLALWDLNAEWTVRPERFLSRSANSAFLGRRLAGLCLLTLAGGQVAFREAVVEALP
jgi:dihydroorotase